MTRINVSSAPGIHRAPQRISLLTTETLLALSERLDGLQDRSATGCTEGSVIIAEEDTGIVRRMTWD